MTPFEEYLSIVLYWQNNPPPEGVACHVHHIWPKSCGGPDEDWNKVRLPIKEHYKCHKLLPLIYTGKEQLKMAKAWHRMHFSDDGVEITAEEYERLMTLHSEAQRQRMLGTKHTEETKEKMRGRTPWNKGKETGPQSEEHRKAIGDGNRGKPKCLGMGQHLSEAIMGHPGYFTGKHHNEDTRRKISAKKKGIRTSLGMTGHHHSEATKQKIRDALAKRKQAKIV